MTKVPHEPPKPPPKIMIPETLGHVRKIPWWIGRSVGGYLVGREKVLLKSYGDNDHSFRAVVESMRDTLADVEAKLAALAQEVAKGEDAHDVVVANLVDGIVEVMPGTASAMVSDFARLPFQAVASVKTTLVLNKLRDK